MPATAQQRPPASAPAFHPDFVQGAYELDPPKGEAPRSKRGIFAEPSDLSAVALGAKEGKTIVVVKIVDMLGEVTITSGG